MPNWCDNELVVSGPSNDDLAAFVAAVSSDDEPLSFETVLPTPTFPEPDIDTLRTFMEVLSGEREPYDWYTWRVVNWGTKWEPDGVDLILGMDEKRPTATYRFLTAWSPPLAFLQAVSARHPKLWFTLTHSDEEGNRGVTECAGGTIVGGEPVGPCQR